MSIPEIRYAKSANVHIAYQVEGDGEFDLVFVPGFVSNLEHYWTNPRMDRFFRRLAAFSRLIMFDKRGTGLSDRSGRDFTLEQRMDDVRAVMDAVGSERAALFGISEGGAMSILFAATYPDRTRALVLYGAYAHHLSWVTPADQLEASIAKFEKTWGTGESLRLFAPDSYHDPAYRAWWTRFERVSASPSAVMDLMRMNSEIDVRSILPAIRVPTLVLHRVHDTRVNVEAGRYLARHISGAKYVELIGRDHALSAGDTDTVADQIEEFLTGSRHVTEPDRMLATVLFTDIVDSTKHASEIGDRRWRDLLDQHDIILREEIARSRGSEVKALGDGFLAIFDGPARAVRCAVGIAKRVESNLGLQVRSGLHTGEIELRSKGDIGGIAVHIAARVSALAEPGQVLVSGTVRDLVAGSGLKFSHRGTSAVKGIQDDVRLYSVDL
jgi:class 3 adenylate cyclase